MPNIKVSYRNSPKGDYAEVTVEQNNDFLFYDVEWCNLIDMLQLIHRLYEIQSETASSLNVLARKENNNA